MNRDKYIRMPAGSLVRVEDDRIVEVLHPNAVIINFAVSCIAAFLIGVVIILGLAR